MFSTKGITVPNPDDESHCTGEWEEQKESMDVAVRRFPVSSKQLEDLPPAWNFCVGQKEDHDQDDTLRIGQTKRFKSEGIPAEETLIPSVARGKLVPTQTLGEEGGQMHKRKKRIRYFNACPEDA